LDLAIDTRDARVWSGRMLQRCRWLAGYDIRHSRFSPQTRNEYPDLTSAE